MNKSNVKHMSHTLYGLSDVKDRIGGLTSSQFDLLRLLEQAPYLCAYSTSADLPRRLARLNIAQIEKLTRRRFLIGSGSLALGMALAGCESVGETATPVSGEMRTVEHTLGETQVPLNPQRIVALDSHIMLDCVVSLGFTPVGIGTIPNVADYAPWLRDELEDAEGILDGVLTADYAPNLEKIAALQPDLILGWSYQEEHYAELSEIAPTVIISSDGGFKTYIEKVSEVTGTEGQTEELLARYEERVGSVRAKVAGTKVSVVRPREETLILYGPPSDPGLILTDLGIEIQPVPDSIEGFAGNNTRTIGEASLEYIPELSGEHIFLISYDLEETEFEDVNQAAVEELLSGPLWQQLEAVQEGRIHPVPGLAWTNHGPLGAIEMIDNVEQALVGTE